MGWCGVVKRMAEPESVLKGYIGDKRKLNQLVKTVCASFYTQVQTDQPIK